MLMQFLEGKSIVNAAGGSNTGDGIRTVQHLGAALWHMWHIHGSYGFHQATRTIRMRSGTSAFRTGFPAMLDE
jgi:hypothetical protein